MDPSPRVMEIKTKLNKWGLIKLTSFCNEIITHRLGENFCKQCDQQGINSQNIEKTYVTQQQQQQQTHKQANLKNGQKT